MSGGLSFLAALFGGAYWGAKYSNDKSAHKRAQEEYDSIHAEDESRRVQWMSMVTDKKLEAELEDKLYHRESAVMSELASSWGNYYDGDMPKLIVQNKETRYRFIECPSQYQCVNSLTLLRMLMANRGLLTFGDAELGMEISLNMGDTTLQRERNYDEQLDFARAIDVKLKNSGISETMYIYLDGTCKYFSIDERRIGGKIMWRPMISTNALRFSETLKEQDEAWL